ncbi:MAG: DUF488 domain-containing protein [Cyanobacteriota bacterium]
MATIATEDDSKTISNMDRLILTFGYGNRTNHEVFLDYLHEFNVTCVIDVRLSPRAWSRQWYKEQIEKICSYKKIKYFSKESLGNTSGKSNWIPPDYDKARETLIEISKLAEVGTILLLCAEMDSSKCHRVDVACELQKLVDVPIKHLK